MSKKYASFTLVEMLIVMGIIIILMVVGVTAGRFAINRANDVAHRNAADQIYTSLQAYYTDFREYPSENSEEICSNGCTIAGLVGSENTPGELVPYIDEASFNGGSNASYFYGVGGDGGNQAVLVCVTLRGNAPDNNQKDNGEIYCNGNGFGVQLTFENGSDFVVQTSEIQNPQNGDNMLHVLTAWDHFSNGGSEWDKGWIPSSPPMTY